MSVLHIADTVILLAASTIQLRLQSALRLPSAQEFAVVGL